MKLEQIRNLFDISQKELSVFLGISRSVIGMALIKRRELTMSDSNAIDAMHNAVFKESGPFSNLALNSNQQANEALVAANIQVQMVSLATLAYHKEKELAMAQRSYQKLQSRFLAIMNLEETYATAHDDMTPIRLKWIEQQKLQTHYKLKTEGLSRLFQIELELDQLKSKQAFLQERVGK